MQWRIHGDRYSYCLLLEISSWHQSPLSPPPPRVPADCPWWLLVQRDSCWYSAQSGGGASWLDRCCHWGHRGQPVSLSMCWLFSWITKPTCSGVVLMCKGVETQRAFTHMSMFSAFAWLHWYSIANREMHNRMHTYIHMLYLYANQPPSKH